MDIPIGMKATIEKQMRGVFSVGSVPRLYNEDKLPLLLPVSHVEAGSNTSTNTLRVLGGDEKGTQCLGYNRSTLFLRDINMGTWPSRLGKSQI
jgi:hypothetical protein